jgi:hypothetical protein
MTDYNDINIFDPKYLYPSEVREEKPKEKKQHEMTAVEKRLAYKKKVQERSDNRKINHIRATDSYVQSIENELIQARTYLSVKNLKEDFNEFNNKYGVNKNDKEDDKEKKSKQES